MTTGALETRLRSLRAGGAVGIIPYVTAGDPDVETTQEILVALADAGAAAIEVGVPFSDPIADGPVIQAASERALRGGTTLARILDMLGGCRQRIAVPIVLFSYVNPIARMGERAFALRASEAGVDGLLLTDAPPGMSPDLERALDARGLAMIRLVAPTTPQRRIGELVRGASGFVYVIARRGVTGQGGAQAEVGAHIGALRALTDLPLYIGFGVRTAADVAALGALADGVVVGSALVERLHDEPDPAARPERAAAFLRALLAGAGER